MTTEKDNYDNIFSKCYVGKVTEKDWVKLGLSPSTVVEDMDSTKLLRSKMVQALCDYKAAYDNSTALTPEQDPVLNQLYDAYVESYNEYMDRLEDV